MISLEISNKSISKKYNVKNDNINSYIDCFSPQKK